MKKAEIILGAIILIALVFDVLLLPGGGILKVLSFTTLSVFYMFLSFALFNGVRLRQILKKNSYKGISAMRIVGAVLTGYALTLTVIGLLFKFQYWTGGTINLVVGLSLLLIAFIVGVIKYFKNKTVYYTQIFKRIAVYGGLGLTLLLLPKDTWLKIKYRDYPDYVEAVKKAMVEPDNQELRDKVEEERIKMYLEQ